MLKCSRRGVNQRVIQNGLTCNLDPAGTSSFEDYEHNVDNLALEVVVKRSLFTLGFYQVGREALSCHLSMDLLCQEMRDACRERSESLDSSRSLCSECQRSSLVELSQEQSLSLTVDGLWLQGGGDVVREMKKDCERRAPLSHVGWPVSFEFLMLDMVGLWSEGVLSFLLCHLVVFIVLGEFSMRSFYYLLA